MELREGVGLGIGVEFGVGGVRDRGGVRVGVELGVE